MLETDPLLKSLNIYPTIEKAKVYLFLLLLILLNWCLNFYFFSKIKNQKNLLENIEL